jgi:hypothetical protein
MDDRRERTSDPWKPLQDAMVGRSESECHWSAVAMQATRAIIEVRFHMQATSAVGKSESERHWSAVAMQATRAIIKVRFPVQATSAVGRSESECHWLVCGDYASSKRHRGSERETDCH